MLMVLVYIAVVRRSVEVLFKFIIVIYSRAYIVKSVLVPLFAEAWDLRSGLYLARDLDVIEVVFETDSLALFHMAKKGHTTYTPLILLLQEIYILLL